MANEIIEMFGMKMRVIKDNGGVCSKCALKDLCLYAEIFDAPCEDSKGNCGRHFELIPD